MGHVIWDWLGSLRHNADFWNPFWAAVFGAVAGAAAAFALERQRREAQRIGEEIGKCYTLHFYVIHMASVLGEFQEHLFGKAGDPQRSWDRIGSLEGAPEHGPDFETEKYAFLLDGQDGKALALLNKVYLARVNFNATLVRLHARNRLWSELFERRLGSLPGRGESAIDTVGRQQAVGARVHELTEWLRADFRETIEELEAILPLLQQAFESRYPNRSFIVSLPKPVAEPTQSSGS